MDIIELLTPHYEAAWLPWAVQYFFLAGLATGAALLATWSLWSRPDGAARQALPLIMVLLATTAISAPVALLADLHQPARFWHFYVHITPCLYCFATGDDRRSGESDDYLFHREDL